MGQLMKRGDMWWIRYYRDGRRYAESARSRKETDARRLLRLREGDIERGLPVAPKIGRLRFEEAANDLVNDYKTNGRRTLDDAQRRIDLHLAPFFGRRRMSSISITDVREYIAQRLASTVVIHRGRDVTRDDGTTKHYPERRRVIDGASPGEINRELTALKRMFRLAAQAGKLLVVPYIPMLRESNVRTGFFEREQFEAVREHLPTYAQPIVTFAYYTGWRIDSEVLPLEWRKVDFDAGTIQLDPGSTKNDEGRLFMFEAIDELRRTLETLRDQVAIFNKARASIIPWVFHRDGARVRTFRRAWASACTAAGCPGRIPHDFRRTAVRNLVRAGVPERVAMAMTGHKTRSVFERYNIVSSSDLVSAGVRLGEYSRAVQSKRAEG
jgi:integrase